jgi:peptidoglycan/xylan/chitin deacetylase (PgdA/CDA1 family)
MRILHLLSQTELTGAEVYAQNLSSLQKANGHEVYVISDHLHIPFQTPSVNLPLSENKWSTRRRNIRFVRQFLLDKKIDVIHCHSRAAVRVAHGARRKLGVSQVSTIHGRQHLSWGKRILDTYGEYKILVCENLRHQFETELRSAPGSLRVIRNPFSIPTSIVVIERPPRKKIAFVGRSSGPKGERLKLLFSGGLFEFLKKHPDWKFDIIASNPDNFGAEFLEQIRTWQSPTQIRILSEIKDLQSEYQSYDVILGAGRVAVEALIKGCAVISFGEFTSHGLVTQRNLPECLASNFGDIGTESHEGPLNETIILEELEALTASQSISSTSTVLDALGTQYNQDEVYEDILETYKASIFKRNVRKGVPILMYHKIPLEELQTQHRIFVTRTQFEKHLDFFKNLHFESLSFKDLSDFWNLQRPYSEFPRKPLLLTFDDGYKDNLHNALPALETYQMKATLFLLSNHSILENTWDISSSEPASELMNFEERHLIANSPLIEIGSHGMDHHRLTELDYSKVLYQLHHSKILLEMEFRRPVIAFAYPFGSIDDRMPNLAKLAGYEFAVNTDQGAMHLADNPRSLFRVNIFPEETRFSLWKKTSPWYRKRFYRKHGK